MTHRCTICAWMGSIPEDAVLLTEGKGKGNHVQTYRFGQTVHALKKVKPPMTENQHKRWHAARKRILCPFCFPPKSTGEADETIKTESLAVPQTQAEIAPPGEGSSPNPGRSSAHIQAVLDSKKDQPDTTSLAAALRKAWKHQEESKILGSKNG